MSSSRRPRSLATAKDANGISRVVYVALSSPRGFRVLGRGLGLGLGLGLARRRWGEVYKVCGYLSGGEVFFCIYNISFSLALGYIHIERASRTKYNT